MNTITTDARTLLQHLITTYGAVEQEEVDDTEEKLKAKVFDITQPLVYIFNEVEEL